MLGWWKRGSIGAPATGHADCEAQKGRRPHVSRRGIFATIGLTPAPRLSLATGPTTDAAAFGAVGDGRADATDALNVAARAVTDDRGVLYVPPGRYRLTSPITLKSGTTLSGAGATIFAADEWRLPKTNRILVSNAGRMNTTIVDHDISVRDVAFEFIGYQFGDAHAVQFRKARGIAVEGCSFSGGGNGTAFLACLDTEVAGCVSQGTLNCAFDHWEGSQNCLVRDCMATCAQSYGILFTGLGTSLDDDEHAGHLRAINNRINSPTEAGIWVSALSQHSSVEDVVISGNHVYGGARNAGGIGASGDVRGITIENNTVEDIDGGPAIFVRPDRWNRPRGARIVRNRLIRCNISGASVALIQALGDDVEVSGNRAVSSRFPSMVWADGKHVILRDNSGDGLGPSKYNVTGTVAPTIADP